MCIIAIQPKGTKIKESTLLNCWKNNLVFPSKTNWRKQKKWPMTI